MDGLHRFGRRGTTRTAALAITAALVLGACSSGAPAASAREVSASRLTAADVAIPPRSVETVLVVRGGAVTNASEDGRNELRLTMADLGAMRTVEAEVYEPFLKRRVTFRGVPFEDVLAFAGVPASAKTLSTVALNEYAVDIPASVVRTPGVIIATSMDGAAIPVDDAGPIRIVFTDDHPDAKNESYWNWSLASVTVLTEA